MSKLVDKDALHVVEEDDVRPPPLYDEEAGRPQVVTADTARQGPLGKPVLWVLIGAVVLCGVSFLVAWMFA
jgi:hypothetical protein